MRRRVIRRKYVHRLEIDRAPLIAPLPEKLQERCLAAPGLLAQIVVAKYCDHLPLYRQEQIYWNRHRMQLSRQTIATWMGLVADWLEPIYKCIRTGVMAGGYVQNGRNADRISLSRPWADQARLSLDLQQSGR